MENWKKFTYTYTHPHARKRPKKPTKVVHRKKKAIIGVRDRANDEKDIRNNV